MSNFKFKPGTKVSYTLINSPLFTGTIIEIDPNPKNKPYIILGTDGKIYYAHAKFLKAI
jgi:hypothetical protein